MAENKINVKHNFFILLSICLILFVLLILSGCKTNNIVNLSGGDSIDAGDNMNTIVVIETSKGNIEVELDKEKAPITVDNFLSYVNDGFYDGLIFHRVIKGFMVQGGGFSTDFVQKETKPAIKLESDNGLKNTRGTVAMARTNVPDSATSQFFINTVDNGFLNYASGNPGYTVFGKVVSGMDVVDAIESVEIGNKGPFQNVPKEDVVINKVYVKKG